MSISTAAIKGQVRVNFEAGTSTCTVCGASYEISLDDVRWRTKVMKWAEDHLMHCPGVPYTAEQLREDIYATMRAGRGSLSGMESWWPADLIREIVEWDRDGRPHSGWQVERKPKQLLARCRRCGGGNLVINEPDSLIAPGRLLRMMMDEHDRECTA